MNFPVLDTDLLSSLDETVGAQGRDALLVQLANESERVLEKIQQFIDVGAFDRLRSEAKALRSLAARAGAFQLIDCLLHLELYASQQSIDAVFIAKLQRAAQEVAREARAVIG